MENCLPRQIFYKKFTGIKNFKPDKLFFYLLILFLPTQLGKHLWPSWTLVNGLKIDYLSPTIFFTDILLILTIIFWFADIYKKNKVKNIKSCIINSKFYILALFFFFLFSFFYLNPPAHILKLFKFLELLLFGLYVSKEIKTMKQLNNVTILLSLGILFESSLSIFQFIKQSSIGGLFYWFGERTFNNGTPGIAQAILNGKLILRPYGTFSHPNILGGYFLVALFLLNICHCEEISPRNRRSNLFIKFTKIIIYILIFETIFLSFSRSVWMVSGALFLTIGILNIKKLFLLIPKNKPFFIIFIIFITIITFIIKPPLVARFQSLQTTDKESLTKRTDLNTIAFKMWQSSPIIGVGLNNFIPNTPRFTKTETTVRWYQPVHNIYLLILAETGLIGFGLFLWFFYKTFKNIFLNQKSHLLNPLIIVLALGVFDHYFLTLQQTQLLFSLVLGLIWNKNL